MHSEFITRRLPTKDIIMEMRFELNTQKGWRHHIFHHDMFLFSHILQVQNVLQWFSCHLKAEILLNTCVKFCLVILNSRGVVIILVRQIEGGGGSLCSNSMWEKLKMTLWRKFNFLVSIDKLMHIFINSLPIALNLVPKLSI